MRKILIIIAFMLAAGSARAQYISVAGYVQQGGANVVVGGQPPTVNTYLRTYPGATVTVCVAGTSCATLAPNIYTTYSGTSKANPFTADPVTAAYQFFAPQGHYDIRFSGTGISTPWTISNITVGNNGIGNSTSVLDATIFAGSDCSVQINAAFSFLNTTQGTVDARGCASPVTMSVSVSIPASDTLILPNATITQAVGVSFIQGSYSHLYGQGIYGTLLEKANTTTDYTPFISCASSQCFGTETDHLYFGLTASPGMISTPITVTAVANASGGNTAYTINSYSGCATNGCTGTFFIYGSGASPLASPTNGGIFPVTASTSTSLTATNSQGTAESGTTGTAVQLGGAAMVGEFEEASVHDILAYTSDVGIEMLDFGSCDYNHFSNVRLITQHLGLYVGADCNSDNFDGILAWANDVTTEGQTNATGVGAYFKSNQANEVKGFDCENSKYCLILDGATFSNKFTNFYFESNYAKHISATAGSVSLPTLFYGALNNAIDSPVDVLDQSGNTTNVYGSVNSRYPVKNFNGSVQVNTLGTVTAQASAVGTAGTGTTYSYAVVAVDWNGNKTLQSSTVTVTNGTLGSTYVNAIQAGTSLSDVGVKCWDILKYVSSTWYSIATCYPGDLFALYDNGLSTSAYTLPTRNSTGDMAVTGNVSVGGALQESAVKGMADTCSMSSSTSCTVTGVTATYANTPICIASEQGTGAIAGSCALSGTTVTITAASSNSGTWGYLLIGHPN